MFDELKAALDRRQFDCIALSESGAEHVYESTCRYCKAKILTSINWVTLEQDEAYWEVLGKRIAGQVIDHLGKCDRRLPTSLEQGAPTLGSEPPRCEDCMVGRPHEHPARPGEDMPNP
jgi:hypothetical protein